MRKEAQDLGQALRQWVAEAEAEAEDAKAGTGRDLDDGSKPWGFRWQKLMASG